MKLYYLFCNGSRGDCEPAVSLAQYMIVKGNRVRIYSNQKNKKFLEKSEIDHNIILKNYIFRQPEEVTSLEYYDEFKNSIIYHIDLINSIDEKDSFEILIPRAKYLNARKHNQNVPGKKDMCSTLKVTPKSARIV